VVVLDDERAPVAFHGERVGGRMLKKQN
jgi:hypothetical protein